MRHQRLAAVTLAAALLTGCFAQGSGSAGDGQEGALTIAMAFPPSQAMSPYGDDAVTLSRLAVVEGLTALDTDGQARPALATSWEQDDETHWTFELREAVFHDGDSLNADAVIRSLTAAQEASPTPRALSDTGLTVTAEGERTLRIATSEPDPVLPQRLANPSLAVLSEAAYAEDRVNPVGHATGPFVLARLNGADSAVLERHDDYWGDPAQTSLVEVEFTPDGQARANALRAGQVDIAEYVPVSQASAVADEEIHEVPTARTNSLYLNTERGPLVDPALRAAVREAVDGDSLAKSVYEGYADPGQGLFGPALAWADDLRQPPVGRAEPARAADIEATEEIVLATYTNRPELPEVAAVVEQQLVTAGFTVRQEVRDYSQMEASALDGGYDIFLLPRNTLLDTGDPLSHLASDFTCAGSFNLAQLCEESVDTAVQEAARQSDLDARWRDGMVAEARILGTDAVVPLVHERFLQGIVSGVEGVSLDPMERTLLTAHTRREG